MRILLTDINKVVGAIKQMASDVKTPFGVLADIKDGRVGFVYTDGKKAIYTEVDAETSDEDVAIGKVVFEYNGLMNMVAKCQPTATLKVGSIEFGLADVVEHSRCDAMAIKYTESQTSEQEDEDIVTVQMTNKVKSKLIVYPVNENLDRKYQNLTRFNYEEVLFGADESHAVDTWDKEELLVLLGKLSKGDDNKAAYILKNDKAGFVVNKSSVYYIKSTGGLENVSFTINCKTIKYVTEALNKVDAESVNLFTTDNRYCSIVTEDNSFGIWFEMAAYRPQDGKVLERYRVDAKTGEAIAYDDLEMLFTRDSFIDFLKMFGKDKKDALQFSVDCSDEEAKKCVAAFKTEKKPSESSEGSESDEDVASDEASENKVRVDLDSSSYISISFKSKTEEAKTFCQAKIKDASAVNVLTAPLSVWLDILGTCRGDYVKISIHVENEKTNYVKFTDTDYAEDGSLVDVAYMYTISSNKEV